MQTIEGKALGEEVASTKAWRRERGCLAGLRNGHGASVAEVDQVRGREMGNEVREVKGSDPAGLPGHGADFGFY